MKKRWWPLLSIVTMLFMLILTACNDDNGNAANPAGNLTISDISLIEEEDAYAEHLFKISYSLASDAVFSEGVLVHFHIVSSSELREAADLENGQEMENAHFLGADYIEHVREGLHHRALEFVIPKAISLSGDYKIIGHVDPYDDIVETDEDDNAGSGTPSVEVFVDTSYASMHNIAVKSFELNDPFAVIDRDDDISEDVVLAQPYYGNTEINGHATIMATGEIPSDGVILKAQIGTGGIWWDLEMWDSESGQFVNALNVAIPDLNREIHVALDLNIPDDVVAILPESAIREGGTVRVVADSDDFYQEVDDSDNEFKRDIRVFMMPLQAGLVGNYLEKSYAKLWGDKTKFAAGLDFKGKIGVENVPVPGVLMQTKIETPIYIFRAENLLIKAEDRRSWYADEKNTRYQTKIEFLGTKIYEEKYWLGKLEKEFKKKWEHEKDVAKARFIVGPAPVSVTAGVKGDVELDMKFGIFDTFYSKNKLPHINFDIYTKGGLDFGVASVGFIFDFILINEALDINADAELHTFRTVNDEWSLAGASMKLEVINALDTISGKIGIYEDYKVPKICKKWGVPYPCGSQKKEATLWIYKTPGSLYDKKETLFKKNWSKDFAGS